jgi:hypothetical protein
MTLPSMSRRTARRVLMTATSTKSRSGRATGRTLIAYLRRQQPRAGTRSVRARNKASASYQIDDPTADARVTTVAAEMKAIDAAP